MSDPRKKRPCCICRHWFRPDPRVGGRQRACGKAECRASLRQKSQASWRRRNPGYAIAYRIDQRAAQTEPPEVLSDEALADAGRVILAITIERVSSANYIESATS